MGYGYNGVNKYECINRWSNLGIVIIIIIIIIIIIKDWSMLLHRNTYFGF